MEIPFRLPPMLRSDAQSDDKQVASKLIDATQLALTRIVKRNHVASWSPCQCDVITGRDGDWDLLTFRVPYLFENGADPLDNAVALRILLNLLIGFNIYILTRGSLINLYRSGTIYKRTEEWDTLLPLFKQKWGDCKSLTGARIAELRRAGISANPVFRFQPGMSAKHDDLYHILIQVDRATPYSVYDGSAFWEDPSKVCGMNQNENNYRAVG